MRHFTILFLCCFVLGFSQKYSKQEKAVLMQAKRLDSLMQNNNSNILNLFAKDVSFGHSNGWVQNFEDFKKDLNSKKVIYKNIDQIEISEAKKYKNIYSVRRKIKVSEEEK